MPSALSNYATLKFGSKLLLSNGRLISALLLATNGVPHSFGSPDIASFKLWDEESLSGDWWGTSKFWRLLGYPRHRIFSKVRSCEMRSPPPLLTRMIFIKANLMNFAQSNYETFSDRRSSKKKSGILSIKFPNVKRRTRLKQKENMPIKERVAGTTHTNR